MKIHNKKSIGKKGEDLARKFFQNQGFIIVESNFHTRYGEIDLILRKDKTFRFVEVKFRRTLDYGLPQESVVKRKQEKIRKVALFWLKMRNLPMDTEVHFDVLGIKEEKRRIEYEYLTDAF